MWHPMQEDPGRGPRLEGLARRTGDYASPSSRRTGKSTCSQTRSARTRTYSNRFAAHVIKQHQFNALCAARGWKNKLRLMVDDEYPPATRELPAWGLRAEFWVEGLGDNYGADTTEAGTYLYLATDQVRFYNIDARANYAHAGGGGYAAAWREGHSHRATRSRRGPTASPLRGDA